MKLWRSLSLALVVMSGSSFKPYHIRGYGETDGPGTMLDLYELDAYCRLWVRGGVIRNLPLDYLVV